MRQKIAKIGSCLQLQSTVSVFDIFPGYRIQTLSERLGFNLLRPALARPLDLDGAFQEGFRLQEDSIPLPQDLRYGRFKPLKSPGSAIHLTFRKPLEATERR